MNTGDYPSAVVYNFLQPIVATWGPRGFEAAGRRVSLEERAVLGCSAVARIQFLTCLVVVLLLGYREI